MQCSASQTFGAGRQLNGILRYRTTTTHTHTYAYLYVIIIIIDQSFRTMKTDFSRANEKRRNNHR